MSATDEQTSPARDDAFARPMLEEMLGPEMIPLVRAAERNALEKDMLAAAVEWLLVGGAEGRDTFDVMQEAQVILETLGYQSSADLLGDEDEDEEARPAEVRARVRGDLAQHWPQFFGQPENQGVVAWVPPRKC